MAPMSSPTPRSERTRPFTCEQRHSTGRVCKKAYGTKGNLKRHYITNKHDFGFLFDSEVFPEVPSVMVYQRESSSASPQSATDSGNTPSESSNSGFPQHHQEASATTSPSMHRGANQPNLEHPKKYGRIEKARVQDSMPTYDVPHSKKFGDQQKGLNWLSQHGKQRFDEFHRKLLASWGVKPGYESTCVLCPEDWSGLEPTLLLRQFTTQKCPTKGAGRLSYAYSDHSTSYARALVWFASQSWPRSGIELDNFLGFGPFKPKDASHTCHHEYCLVHLVFEAADVNQDRKVCHDLAMFLRREGLPIPKHCDRHDQPCLMQLAALSTLERFAIQFNVLSQAKGLQEPSIERPRWHGYPTFECGFPLSESFDLAPNLEYLENRPTVKQCSKPDLLCTFCTRIKGFKSIVGLWSHIYHKHPDIENEKRLQEIQSSATLWTAHWERIRKKGTQNNETAARLLQTASKNFNWEIVKSWNLRM